MEEVQRGKEEQRCSGGCAGLSGVTVERVAFERRLGGGERILADTSGETQGLGAGACLA